MLVLRVAVRPTPASAPAAGLPRFAVGALVGWCVTPTAVLAFFVGWWPGDPHHLFLRSGHRPPWVGLPAWPRVRPRGVKASRGRSPSRLLAAALALGSALPLPLLGLLVDLLLGDLDKLPQGGFFEAEGSTRLAWAEVRPQPTVLEGRLRTSTQSCGAIRDDHGLACGRARYATSAYGLGYLVGGWAAWITRCRTASGLCAGMPRPWRVKALRSDGQVVPNWAAAALMLPSRSASWKARSASARSARKRLGCQPSGW